MFSWTITKPAPSPFIVDSSLLRHGTLIYFLRCITSSSETSTAPKQMAMRGSFQDCNFHWVNLQNTSDLDVLDMDMAGQGHPWSTSTQPGRRTSTAVISSPFSSSETCKSCWWQLVATGATASFLGQSGKATLLITDTQTIMIIFSSSYVNSWLQINNLIQSLQAEIVQLRFSSSFS